jgi:hypothetical protein
MDVDTRERGHKFLPRAFGVPTLTARRRRDNGAPTNGCACRAVFFFARPNPIDSHSHGDGDLPEMSGRKLAATRMSA